VVEDGFNVDGQTQPGPRGQTVTKKHFSGLSSGNHSTKPDTDTCSIWRSECIDGTTRERELHQIFGLTHHGRRRRRAFHGGFRKDPRIFAELRGTAATASRSIDARERTASHVGGVVRGWR